MKIKFLGASGMVTGSSYLLTSRDGNQILVDLGTFQGKDEVTNLNYEPLAFDGRSLSGVLLTHAHLDHCGRLPLLVKANFSKKIYMTDATRELANLTLLDSAKVSSEHESAYHRLLYDKDDVKRVMEMAEIVLYDKQFEVGEFKVTYRDAGHILGSASIEIEVDHEEIVFSGDLGNSPEDLVRPTEIISRSDYVVMESTYGDRDHANEDPEEILKEEINEIEKTGGVLLIPAFAVERSQEILHFIDHLKRDNKVRATTKVFLDSPLAIASTYVYEKFKNLYGSELAEHAKSDDPFDFPGLEMIEDHKESEKIKDVPGAKVIIAGSGMMNGGRILNHAIDFLPLETTRLLMVGFQAEGTIGREILDGVTNIRMYDRNVTIHGHIRKSSGMSAHADQPKLLSWLSNIKDVKKVFLTHGEDSARRILSEKVKDTVTQNVFLPKLLEEVML
jgi:metallo-beta-lactamase family protein